MQDILSLPGGLPTDRCDNLPASADAQSRGELPQLPVVFRAVQPGDDTTAFRLLNEEWITRHFTLEPKDRTTLGDPEHSILLQGGHILQAWRGDEVVGCVALIPMGHGEYELSKMAVAAAHRGAGIGRRLLQHAITTARNVGAVSLFLGSNRILADAVHLYESVGFQHLPADQVPPTPYTRANVFMRMLL